MYELQLTVTRNELYYLLQGVRALEQEARDHKMKVLQRQAPGDTNIDTLIEYYDRRGVELKKIETKLLGLIST